MNLLTAWKRAYKRAIAIMFGKPSKKPETLLPISPNIEPYRRPRQVIEKPPAPPPEPEWYTYERYYFVHGKKVTKEERIPYADYVALKRIYDETARQVKAMGYTPPAFRTNFAPEGYTRYVERLFAMRSPGYFEKKAAHYYDLFYTKLSDWALFTTDEEIPYIISELDKMGVSAATSKLDAAYRADKHEKIFEVSIWYDGKQSEYLSQIYEIFGIKPYSGEDETT